MRMTMRMRMILLSGLTSAATGTNETTDYADFEDEDEDD
jgi:hypothetical protein